MGVNKVSNKKHLFALPINSTYLLFSKEYLDYLFNLINDNEGIIKLADTMGFHRTYFYRLKWDKRTSLKFVFSLYNALKLNLEHLENNVIQIVSGSNNSIGINNPRLPFDFNNEYGGTFLAAIMGDGSRTSLGGLIYNNQSSVLIENLIISANTLFGDVHYRLNDKKDKTIQLDFPKIVGDIVALFGITKSYKIKSDCFVDLSNFSKKMKIAFIRQFYDDEGNVRLSDRRLQVKQTRVVSKKSKVEIRKNIEKYTPRVLKELKRALNGFDINSTLALETLRENKGDFSLNIYGKENLEQFRNLIGFKLEYKNNLLIDAINSYKFPSAPRNGRLDFALEKAKLVQEKYGYINKMLLAEESKRSLKTATYFLVDLKKNGLITIKDKPYDSGIPLAHEYTIAKDTDIQ